MLAANGPMNEPAPWRRPKPHLFLRNNSTSGALLACLVAAVECRSFVPLQQKFNQPHSPVWCSGADHKGWRASHEIRGCDEVRRATGGFSLYGEVRFPSPPGAGAAFPSGSHCGAKLVIL